MAIMEVIERDELILSFYKGVKADHGDDGDVTLVTLLIFFWCEK